VQELRTKNAAARVGYFFRAEDDVRRRPSDRVATRGKELYILVLN